MGRWVTTEDGRRVNTDWFNSANTSVNLSAAQHDTNYGIKDKRTNIEYATDDEITAARREQQKEWDAYEEEQKSQDAELDKRRKAWERKQKRIQKQKLLGEVKFKENQHKLGDKINVDSVSYKIGAEMFDGNKFSGYLVYDSTGIPYFLDKYGKIKAWAV